MKRIDYSRKTDLHFLCLNCYGVIKQHFCCEYSLFLCMIIEICFLKLKKERQFVNFDIINKK